MDGAEAAGAGRGAGDRPGRGLREPVAREDAPGAADAHADLAALYDRVDAVVGEARPVCRMSGRCCDFPTSGHVLFATDLESGYALASAGGDVPDAPSGLCPWHVEGTCRLRDGRPLGCRLYFCDPSWEPGMGAVYERFHRELKELHVRHDVEYRYRPFVEAVRDDALRAPTPAPDAPRP